MLQPLVLRSVAVRMRVSTRGYLSVLWRNYFSNFTRLWAQECGDGGAATARLLCVVQTQRQKPPPQPHSRRRRGFKK